MRASSSGTARGPPAGLKAEEIALAARIARVASTATLFAGIGGPELASQAVAERAGGMLDPKLCELFRARAGELLAELEATDPRRLVLAGEPAPHDHREHDELPALAAVFADLVDLKTPFTHGHSRGVAAHAAGAAERLGLGTDVAGTLELTVEARAGRLDPDAVAAVLEVAGQRRRRRRADLRPAELTEREIEVLALVAKGCSNREIAERLVISRRTAEHHVQSIYGKIGDSSRAAAAVFALEHGLLG